MAILNYLSNKPRIQKMTLDQYLKTIQSKSKQTTFISELIQLIDILIPLCKGYHAYKMNHKKNLKPSLIDKIARSLSINFVTENLLDGNVCFANSRDVRPEFREVFTSMNLVDYVYAVIYSSKYVSKKQEVLELDFAIIPLPKDTVIFWNLVALGTQLRKLHVLENPIIADYSTKFKGIGDGMVNEIGYSIVSENQIVSNDILSQIGCVYINKTQYFEGIPEWVWNFNFKGNFVAQQWLKDRKNQKLNLEDIAQYQKIILSITETNKLIKQIDKLLDIIAF